MIGIGYPYRCHRHASFIPHTGIVDIIHQYRRSHTSVPSISVVGIGIINIRYGYRYHRYQLLVSVYLIHLTTSKLSNCFSFVYNISVPSLSYIVDIDISLRYGYSYRWHLIYFSVSV